MSFYFKARRSTNQLFSLIKGSDLMQFILVVLVLSLGVEFRWDYFVALG